MPIFFSKKPSTPVGMQPPMPFASIVAGTPAIEAAQLYAKHGIVPLPVPVGQTAPAFKWGNAKLTPASLLEWFCEPCNISIRTGSQSGELVDVDVDNPGARLIAPHILPHTDCVFGRAPPFSSHYMYRVDQTIKAKKYSFQAGPALGVIVEIRAEKHLTIAPPSLHPKGGTVQFAPGKAGLPPLIQRDVLERKVMLLAIATAIYEVWPEKAGYRQDLALALAGALA
ncbi:MAG: bifunctional DNA primase/polymerase [Rhodospirillaceae bacterium]|nr:bifunctional DNA primase/polymerase [Rhodospirillaceae bacterium]